MEASGKSEGVYYDRSSYAGFWQRFAVDVIDVVIMLGISVLLTIMIIDVFAPSETLATLLFLLWATGWFAYFVLLKRSRFGTLGYKICNVRIVNLYGEKPGVFTMTLRLMFSLIGPLSFPLDLFWISGDENRQALRDKFAKTYVIKKDAEPTGTGRLTYTTYDLWGWRILFCEIKRPLYV